MRFETGPRPPVDAGVQVGDVYQARGGGATAPDFWLVVSVRNSTCSVLGFKAHGDIVSAQSYSTSAFQERMRVGVVEGLSDLTMTVQWLGGSKP